MVLGQKFGLSQLSRQLAGEWTIRATPVKELQNSYHMRISWPLCTRFVFSKPNHSPLHTPYNINDTATSAYDQSYHVDMILIMLIMPFLFFLCGACLIVFKYLVSQDVRGILLKECERCKLRLQQFLDEVYAGLDENYAVSPPTTTSALATAPTPPQAKKSYLATLIPVFLWSAGLVCFVWRGWHRSVFQICKAHCYCLIPLAFFIITTVFFGLIAGESFFQYKWLYREVDQYGATVTDTIAKSTNSNKTIILYFVAADILRLEKMIMERKVTITALLIAKKHLRAQARSSMLSTAKHVTDLQEWNKKDVKEQTRLKKVKQALERARTFEEVDQAYKMLWGKEIREMEDGGGRQAMSRSKGTDGGAYYRENSELVVPKTENGKHGARLNDFYQWFKGLPTGEGGERTQELDELAEEQT